MTRTEKLEALLREAIEALKETADPEFAESFERRALEAMLQSGTGEEKS